MAITVPYYRESQRQGSAPDGRFSINGRALDMASGREAWGAVERAGAALGQTGRLLGDIALKEQREHNQTLTLEKLTEFEQRAQALQGEQSQRQGKNALISADGTTAGVADVMRTSLEQYRTELTKDMNDAQKKLFDGPFQQSALRYGGWGARYEADQRNVWNGTVEDGSMAQNAQRAIGNVNDHGAFLSARGNIEVVMRRRGQRQGWDEAYTKAQTDAYLSKNVYAPSLDAMIERGELKTAQGFLKQFGPEMGTSLVAGFEGKIKRQAEYLEAKAEANRHKAISSTLTGLEEAKDLAIYKGDTSRLEGIAASLRNLGDTKSADAVTLQMELMRANSEARDFAVKSPLGDVAATVSDLNRQIEEGRKNNLPVDTMKTLEQKQSVLSEVFTSRVSALQSDPALAADNAPGTVLPDNATLMDKVEQRLSYQAANGVLESKRKVLTQKEAARLQEEWRTADAARRTALLYGKNGYLEQLGKYTLPALDQIGISPFEQSLAQSVLENPDSVGNARIVFNILALDEKDIPSGVSVTNELQTVLDSSTVYRGFRQMAKATGDRNATQATKQFEQVASRMLRLGHDPSEVQRILDNGRQGVTDSNMALTVPRGLSPSNVETGLRSALETRLPTFLESRPHLDEYGRKQEVQRLRSTGVWTNSPTADGYILLDPVSGSPVTDSKGNTFTVKSGELTVDMQSDWSFDPMLSLSGLGR